MGIFSKLREPYTIPKKTILELKAVVEGAIKVFTYCTNLYCMLSDGGFLHFFSALSVKLHAAALKGSVT